MSSLHLGSTTSSVCPQHQTLTFFLYGLSLRNPIGHPDVNRQPLVEADDVTQPFKIHAFFLLSSSFSTFLLSRSHTPLISLAG